MVSVSGFGIGSKKQLVKLLECIAFEDFWQNFDNMSDMSNVSDVVGTIGNDFGAGSMELEKGQLCLNLMGAHQVLKERVNVLERVRVMEQKIKKESQRGLSV